MNDADPEPEAATEDVASPSPALTPALNWSRRSRWFRAGPLVFLGVAAVVLHFMSPAWPRDQHVRISVGDLAPRVIAVDLEYSDPKHDAPVDADSAHAASFRYDPGKAPRVVDHTVSLPNGQTRVDVVIELVGPIERLEATRTVTLDGENAVTIPAPASASASNVKPSP